jgi:hypothetical protein
MKNLCISTTKISNIESLVKKPFYYRVLVWLLKKFVTERIFNELKVYSIYKVKYLHTIKLERPGMALHRAFERSPTKESFYRGLP